jgi:predicted RNA-binding Zn ribbon-like protein
MADGSWERLKGCPRDVCHWVFYDRSRNRSSTWCAMSVCGNRTNTRAYRRRLAPTH